ncbi:MAG: arginine repressor [Eubacteriales bacterium]|nr:arginine repressor [Clostridiales bacterium]MDD6372805.1 arginine repressor [Eubacteriales bacterium]MDD7259430.1 arginine repressor [Eubacteriales bacterium]MDY6067814.1 arginine repressor [Candidatus Faecousia sp.]
MKAQRQAKIVEIISNANVETQEQLLQALTDQGFNSTQATISRDIKELRIVKELTSLGTYRYCVPEKDAPPAISDRLNNIFRECVISVDYAENLVVIHTLPGMANAAASALDAMRSGAVLGTLAGDDTVVIVMREGHAAAAFSGEIKAVIRK